MSHCVREFFTEIYYFTWICGINRLSTLRSIIRCPPVIRQVSYIWGIRRRADPAYASYLTWPTVIHSRGGGGTRDSYISESHMITSSCIQPEMIGDRQSDQPWALHDFLICEQWWSVGWNEHTRHRDHVSGLPTATEWNKASTLGEWGRLCRRHFYYPSCAKNSLAFAWKLLV